MTIANGRQRRLATVAAVALFAVGAARCGVYLTAPPGSEITLNANPEFVASHGGTSEITAFLMEEAGTPVADGTTVFWSTNLGRIDRETRTRNGFTVARFVSDARSGTATVCAFSGGGAGGGVTTTTRPPSTTSVSSGIQPFGSAWSAASRRPGSASDGVSYGIVGAGVAGASAVSGVAAELCIPIEVGNVRVQAVLLRADPPRITTSNSTHVFALVIDANGNPIENVPVYFDVPSGNTEFFDITGPVFTNNNGEAENVMRTRRQTQGTATVRARAVGPGTFVEDELDIPIL